MKSLNTAIAGIFALSVASASSPVQAQEVSRAATQQELDQYCQQPGLANFAIIATDTSRTKPFNFLSCAYGEVKEADCAKIKGILDISDKVYKLQHNSETAGQTESRNRLARQLGPSYDKLCNLVS